MSTFLTQRNRSTREMDAIRVSCPFPISARLKPGMHAVGLFPAYSHTTQLGIFQFLDFSTSGEMDFLRLHSEIDALRTGSDTDEKWPWVSAAPCVELCCHPQNDACFSLYRREDACCRIGSGYCSLSPSPLVDGVTLQLFVWLIGYSNH